MSGSGRSIGKIRESGRVSRTRKRQEARQKKLKEDYDKSVIRSKNRTYEIQTPDVQARMKRNKAAIAVREKAKDRRTRAASRKTGKKYR